MGDLEEYRRPLILYPSIIHLTKERGAIVIKNTDTWLKKYNSIMWVES